MDVAVSEFRAHLSSWLEKARLGDEIVITDRGIPVARLRGLSTTSALDKLQSTGVISAAKSPKRPRAAGRTRIPARRSLSDIVSEQRR